MASHLAAGRSVFMPIHHCLAFFFFFLSVLLCISLWRTSQNVKHAKHKSKNEVVLSSRFSDHILAWYVHSRNTCHALPSPAKAIPVFCVSWKPMQEYYPGSLDIYGAWSLISWIYRYVCLWISSDGVLLHLKSFKKKKEILFQRKGKISVCYTWKKLQFITFCFIWKENQM